MWRPHCRDVGRRETGTSWYTSRLGMDEAAITRYITGLFDGVDVYGAVAGAVKG